MGEEGLPPDTCPSKPKGYGGRRSRKGARGAGRGSEAGEEISLNIQNET